MRSSEGSSGEFKAYKKSRSSEPLAGLRSPVAHFLASPELLPLKPMPTAVVLTLAAQDQHLIAARGLQTRNDRQSRLVRTVEKPAD